MFVTAAVADLYTLALKAEKKIDSQKIHRGKCSIGTKKPHAFLCPLSVCSSIPNTLNSSQWSCEAVRE